jgi:hypothetical protein
MKYKYIVGLLVALSLNNAFAADMEDPIELGDYQAMYDAFTCRSVKEINAALANNQTFNHKDDTDIIRSSQTGLALRKAVIGLDAADLQAVVETNHEFFKTSLGTSLIYGWTLNQFKEPVTPYYIGYYFSFDKLFQGLADKFASNPQVSTFLKSTFTLGLSAVDADRWAFYDHMLHLPYAIEQVRLTGARTARTSALSIYDVITIAHRTKEEAKSEKARVPGRAAHLDDLSEAARIDCDECNFVNLQKYTVTNASHCTGINPSLLATFQSLPAGTQDTYQFRDKSLSEHMVDFKLAIIDEIEVVHDCAVMMAPAAVNTNYELEDQSKLPDIIIEMKEFTQAALDNAQFKKILQCYTSGLLRFGTDEANYLLKLAEDTDLDATVAEFSNKSVKELAIELCQQLLEADDEKKRAAVEEKRKNTIVIAFHDLKLRLPPKEKVDKLNFLAFSNLILEVREMASQMIDEKFIVGGASKLAKHIETLSNCSLDEEWTSEQVPDKLTGGFFGANKTQIKKRNKEIADAEKNNKIKQGKIEAAKFLFKLIKVLEITA